MALNPKIETLEDFMAAVGEIAQDFSNMGEEFPFEQFGLTEDQLNLFARVVYTANVELLGKKRHDTQYEQIELIGKVFIYGYMFRQRQENENDQESDLRPS
jgi:hypothetical protein